MAWPQFRNKSKLVRIFIGNIANAVVHEVLENAIEEQEPALPLWQGNAK